MAQKTPCQTPGTNFTTEINADTISVHIDLPMKLHLHQDEAILLEANIHNALELALAPFFKKTI